MNGNYTIDKNGTATATNFKTFASAVQSLRGLTRSDGGPSLGTGVNGPVTITVAAGTGPYTEQVLIPAITGASATNRITIDGNGQTIQYSGTSTSNMYTWRMNGADYFTIKNLTVKTLSASYGWGMMFDNNADNNIVEDCRIDITSVSSSTSTYSVGITFTASTTSPTSGTSGSTYNGRNNIIRNNEVFGNPSNLGMYWGIVSYGNSSDYSLPNLFEGNTVRNFYVYGIYAYYSGGVEYKKNVIVRGQKSSYTTFYGIYNYYARSVTYNGNYIADDAPGNYTFTAYGVYDNFPTTTNAGKRVFNNNVVNIQNGGYLYGAALYWYYNTGNDVYNNTVYIRRTSGTYYYGYGLMVYSYTYLDCNVKNNIVDMDYTNYTGTTYGIYLYAYQPKADYNVIAPKTGSNFYTGYTYNNGATLAWTDWQNAGNDPNGNNVRPMYQSTAPGYSTLSPISIDIDGMGTPVGLTEDINGNPRHLTSPDPGAYEFDVPLNVSAILFPGDICQGSTDAVEVTLTNNSSFAVTNFNVEFAIDGNLQSTELYTGTIPSGQSAQLIFANPIVSTNTGTFNLTANVKGKSAIANVNYTVKPAPVGSLVSQGSTFQGSYNSGDMMDPDIVAYGDNINYSILPPTGYTNAQYNSLWAFDKWELVTVNGTSSGAQHQATAPGANNANSAFTPVIAQSDSTYVLRYAIKSISNGCVAPTIERYVFVAPRPVSDFTSLAACAGSQVQFDNNSTISSGTSTYMWYFGDGDSSSLINPAHSYANPGTYNVQLKAVSNYGYASVFNSTAQVIENPVAEFGFTNACEGTAIQFADGSIIPTGTPTYTWNFGDGSAVSNANSPNHLYAQPGSYEVVMVVEVNGCKDEKKAFVTQAPRANVSFTPSAATCNNDMVSFTNNSIYNGTVGYSWDFGDNNNDNSFHTQHTYAQAGNYTVTLTATTAFGCVNSSTSQVNLLEAPAASFTSGNLCSIENLTFTNTSTEPANATTSYQWAFSDGFTTGAKDVTKSFANIGSYSVELRAVSSNGCEDVMTQAISVDEMPVAQFYAADACEGSAVEFQNGSIGNNGNVSYAWDFENDNNVDATTKNASIVLAPGVYTAVLKVTTPSGCTSTQSKSVTVRSLPSATLAVNTAQVGDGVFALSASNVANASSYLWLFGDGGKESGSVSGNSINTVYKYQGDGLYDVSLRLSNQGCDVTLGAEAMVSRTGMGSVEGTAVQVYPNPSKGLVNVQLTEGTSVESVKVFAMDGKEVTALVQNNNNGLVVMNMEGLAPGVYQVQLQTATGLQIAKVTISQ